MQDGRVRHGQFRYAIDAFRLVERRALHCSDGDFRVEFVDPLDKRRHGLGANDRVRHQYLYDWEKKQGKKNKKKTRKNQEKIKAALEIRKAKHKGPGGKVPGSMNKKKTGYAKVK